MTFAHSNILWLMLVVVPATALFLTWAWRTRQALMKQFVQSRLLAQLTVGVSPLRQKWRHSLTLLAVALLFLALAGPRYGFAWEEARQRGLDIVVAIDTSRSMLASDLPPSRLARAKLETLDLLKLAKNDRLGLVAFAGTSFLQCPLTLDEDAFRQSVQALDVGIIPQGGTTLSDAIKTALTAFKDEKENHKILVIFTDGEDHDEDAVKAAREAAQAGLKIFTIGVGTAEGDLLRFNDEKGASTFVKDDQGNVVKSRLNERLLQEIATAANGFYLPLRGTKTVATLYEQGLAPLPKSESDAKLLKRYHERYAWPLGFAILALVIELFIPDRRKMSVTAAEISAATHPNLKGLLALGLMLGCGLFDARASSASAKRAFESGRYGEAAAEFEKLANERKDDPRLRFNAGTAAIAAGDMEKAAGHLAASLSSPDLELQQRSYYNLGNALFQSGERQQDPQQKMTAWQDAVARFESALKLNPSDADAKHNLDFVRQQLEELKKQSQQKPSDKNDKNDKNDQDKKDEDQKSEGQKEKDQQKQGENKDQKSKDPQKDQDSKQGNDSKNNEKKEESKDQKKEQNKDQSGNANKEEQKPDAAQQAGGEKEGAEGKEGTQQAAAKMGQMTQEQAAKILDSQKSEEKALMFIPPKGSKQRARIFKDW